jgi:hypothetical protein
VEKGNSAGETQTPATSTPQPGSAESAGAAASGAAGGAQADTTSAGETQVRPASSPETAPQGTPAPEGQPPAPSGGGGTSVSPTQRREILHQGPREQTYRTGETVRLDGQGGAEVQVGETVARLQQGTGPGGGDDWVDTKTGERVSREVWAKADYRFRELEFDLGLRKSMQR